MSVFKPNKIIKKLLVFTICTIYLAGVATPSFAQTSFCATAPANSFCEDFEGQNPLNPESFRESTIGKLRWDVSVHSRDGAGDGNDYSLLEDPWEAQHDENCAPPPSSHTIQQYEEASFICKYHMMTSIFGPGAAEVILTPNHLVDLSQGEATIRFNLSTKRTTGRDYWQVNITPWEDHHQLIPGTIVADLNGPPKNSIQVGTAIRDGMVNPPGQLAAQQTDANFNISHFGDVWNGAIPGYQTYDYILAQSNLSTSTTRRDAFEIKVSQNHLSVCMPDYPQEQCLIDGDLPQPVDWNRAVVQFSHHSYNPQKSCTGPDCAPNTWHWDQFLINPSIPFSIIKTDTRWQHAPRNTLTPLQFNFDSPAPASSKLRFAALGGNTVQVSFDNGNSWHQAAIQETQESDNSTFWSYFTGDSSGFVPEGSTSVLIRGQQNSWRATDFHVRDVTVWSQEGGNQNQPPPDQGSLIGDTDNDADVDILDLSYLLSKFLTTDSIADFDLSGVVDIFDFNLVVKYFGSNN